MAVHNIKGQSYATLRDLVLWRVHLLVKYVEIPLQYTLGPHIVTQLCIKQSKLPLRHFGGPDIAGHLRVKINTTCR